MNSMHNTEAAAVFLAVIGSSYVLYKAMSTYMATPSAVYTLRGPDSSSWISGHTQIIRAPYPHDHTFDRWIREYGTTFPVQGFFGGKGLLMTDTRAVAFILTHPAEFSKPRIVLNMTRIVLGDGLLSAEGFEHKRQRKILNPAFNATAMGDIFPVLMQVAHDLRDAWKKEIYESASGSGAQDMDIMRWLSSAALDMIGLAGFGYRFNSLHDNSNELASAFRDLSDSLALVKGIGVLSMFFPFLRHVPIGRNVINNRSKAVMERVGALMVMEKKAEVERLGESGSVGGKDLLSLLVRANLQESPAGRLDDKTLSAEISTFLLAGHETTALTITWGLHALATNPLVQSKLRDEAIALPNDSPSMEDLNGLPYLNNVVKEILRLRPSVNLVRRIPRADMIIPLAQPVIDKSGKAVHEIFVKAGNTITIHTYATNTRPDLWGPNALEFMPERFDKLPEAVADIPSLFGSLFTFSAGARGCIGWRMAVLEIKALLFTLIREFQLDIDPHMVITGRLGLSLKPQIQGQEEKGPQLPLRVTRHKA